MTCERAREILWPQEQPKIAEATVVAARRHVEACPECREFFEADRALADRLRSVRLPPAPTELRNRVFQALAEERARFGSPATGSRASVRPSRPGRPSAGGMAVAAVALVVGGWLLLNPSPDGAAPERGFVQPAGAAFVEDFVRRAVQEDRISSSDPGEVTRFLARQLGLPLRPHHFEGFRLVGAEICIVDGKRGAVLLYERDGEMLYHYVLQGAGSEPSAPRLSEAVPGEWPGEAGPSVAIWSSRSYQEALVGDLPKAEILGLARGIRAPF